MTGKNCPRLLLDNGKIGNRWREFIQLIQQELNTISDISSDILSGIESDSNIEDNTNDDINIEVSNDFHVDENEDEIEKVNYLPIESELYTSLLQQAQKNKIKVETMINLWLKQKLKEDSFH